MNVTQTMEPGVCSLWAFFVSGIAAGQERGLAARKMGADPGGMVSAGRPEEKELENDER